MARDGLLHWDGRVVRLSDVGRPFVRNVAAAFDEILGATQSLSGAPGMTGTLSIRYESPTPLMTDLRFEGRLVGVERRKIFVEGSCFAGDRLTATAKGIFISMQPGSFLDLLAEREARQHEQR